MNTDSWRGTVKNVFFFIAKIVEIYKHREQDMNIFLQRTIIEIKRNTNILGLRTSNYGIICTEKCKNKIT